MQYFDTYRGIITAQAAEEAVFHHEFCNFTSKGVEHVYAWLEPNFWLLGVETLIYGVETANSEIML